MNDAPGPHPRAWLAAFALSALLLSGCPSLYVDRGGLVTPSGSLERPALGGLPRASEAIALESRFRREARFGVGDYVSATLVDPRVTAARIAHDGATQSLAPRAIEAALADAWDAAYGPTRDRFPIDVAWRFDGQFQAHPDVLDPANWTIGLDTARGNHYVPLAVSVVSRGQTLKDDFWEGAIRLWFPWRDPASNEPLLGADNAAINLTFAHTSGSGTLTWRFHAAR